MTDPWSLEELAIHLDPVWSWLFVAAVAAGLLAVLLAFPPDRSRLSPAARRTLVLLRLGAFLALLVCMLRPTLVAERKARQQGTVIVLADASESMTVADGPAGRTRWQEMVDALAAARPAARQLAGTGDFDIAVWLFDREARGVPPAGDDPFPFAAWSRVPTATETAIGAALDDGLRAKVGRQLAGVIVLSDGAQQAYAPRDLPPQAVARKLADAGTPLWAVTFGQQRGEGQGRDAAVVNLAVAETVYLKNMLEVAGRAGRPRWCSSPRMPPA